MDINVIYNENNLTTMSRLVNESIDGIIFSPPYNVATKRNDEYYNNGYSQIDNLSEDEYIQKRLTEFKEFDRILKNCGVICYNISYHNENPILPLLLMGEVHRETNLTVADIIVWKKPHSIPFQTSPTKLSRICETIYVIVKKDNLNGFKTNKKISKINEKTNQKFYKNYTNFIEAKNNDGIKSKLKAAYSEELVRKIMDIYFPENSIIYDPFMGIGTTARSCVKNNRNYIGSELDKDLYSLSIDLMSKL